jgi:3-oxoadipate enol-lactonase/4-carboxymuconolactone decarboxylase
MALWDRVMPLLTRQFRVLRMDARGHGASDAPSGDYTLRLLAEDAACVLAAAGVREAAVCGISLGGMVAMQLAILAPNRVRGLMPVCTSAAMDPSLWLQRLSLIRAEGMKAIADAAIVRFFAERFRNFHPEIVAGTRATLLAQAPDGYCGCGAAIRDMALLGDLSRIAVPTLVVGGRLDVSTPFAAHGAHIVAAIPGARAAMLDTAHLAALEDPSGLAALIVEFFAGSDRVRDAGAALYESGLRRRREVLGNAWVDRSLSSRSEFTGEFQDFITRIAWHEIWTRPGLDERTRRLLVIAVTAALGRWEEFRLHARAGLQRGGFTVSELKEALMQTAIYAGVPAANTGFAEAAEILADLAGELEPPR